MGGGLFKCAASVRGGVNVASSDLLLFASVFVVVLGAEAAGLLPEGGAVASLLGVGTEAWVASCDGS